MLYYFTGFPAHPHAGFDTVTYCIDGGLCHRDSEGLKMSYGDGEVQWMRAGIFHLLPPLVKFFIVTLCCTGRGTIHEEMWDLKSSSMSHKRIEIFQLWVNLKEKNKNDAPSVHLLKNNDIPVVTVGDDVATIKVISGCLNIIGNSDDDSIEAIHRLSKEDYHITSINGVTPSKKLSLCQSTIDQQVIGPGSAVAASPVSILHITIKPNEEIALATSVKSTVFAYVRKGSLLTSRSSTDGETDSDVEEVRKNKNIVFRPLGLSESSTDAAVVLKAGKKGFDGIILMGEPINERVIWRGPLVQSTEEKLLEKSMIFDRIGMKAYWNNGDSDEKWTEHCQQLQLQKTIKTLLNKK